MKKTIKNPNVVHIEVEHPKETWQFIYYLDGKIIDFMNVRKMIEEAKTEIIVSEKNCNFKNQIICGLRHDDPWGGTIPIVLESKHERFVRGTRFDYGFMQCSIDDGYYIKYTGIDIAPLRKKKE